MTGRLAARLCVYEFLLRQKGGAGEKLSEEEAMRVALEAQRTARRQLRKRNPAPRQSRK